MKKMSDKTAGRRGGGVIFFTHSHTVVLPQCCCTNRIDTLLSITVCLLWSNVQILLSLFRLTHFWCMFNRIYCIVIHSHQLTGVLSVHWFTRNVRDRFPIKLECKRLTTRWPPRAAVAAGLRRRHGNWPWRCCMIHEVASYLHPRRSAPPPGIKHLPARN